MYIVLELVNISDTELPTRYGKYWSYFLTLMQDTEFHTHTEVYYPFFEWDLPSWQNEMFDVLVTLVLNI
jgi:hypothetical protein